MATEEVDLTISATETHKDDGVPAVIEQLLEPADIRINGQRPWDIQVFDHRLYHEVLTHNSLGLGEAYMAGMWECDDLSGMFTRLLRARLDEVPLGSAKFYLALHYFHASLQNLQSKRRAFQVGEEHYDIGNDLYQAMLDSNWCYSCGYWAKADNLEDAQVAKMDLICRKLQLKPGMTVLDVGCGWGSLSRFMAANYGVNVTGITVSKEQVAMGAERCQGLPVSIELKDYRDLTGQFDRIVSVGMFEHVGHKNYAEFFDIMHRCLADDGLFLLHSIGRECSTDGADPWIDKYIFPNGELPSVARIGAASEGKFLIEDLHNFGPDYDRTLMAWWDNFQQAWPQLQGDKYDARFARMWRYYLQACAGFFRSKRGQLWQLVLSKVGTSVEYRSIR